MAVLKDVDDSDNPNYAPTGYYYHESAVRELVEALGNYGAHETGCVAGQCRAGRPTADGGYDNLYGYGELEKWYPRDETPPCTCGLDEIFDHYKDLPSD